MTDPAVYDHLWPTGTDYPDGTYRVVGTENDAVTLLRVANAQGRRVATGEVVSVPREELGGFDAAENPDGNRPLGAALNSKMRALYWSARVFARNMLANPRSAALALAVLLVGVAGDGVLSLPDALFPALTLVGALSLAYVGSGRLS